MKKLLLLAGLLVCLVSTPLTEAAHADTIVQFGLTGTISQNKGFGLGSFTVNTTTGVVQSINFDFSYRNAYTTENPYSPGDAHTPAGYNFTELFDSFGGYGSSSGGSYSSITIVVPVTTFVGYTGGLICSVNNSCGGLDISAAYQSLRSVQFQDGYLYQQSVLITAPTPEPSSISYLLLSLALLGGLPFVRRRVLQSCA